MRLQKNLLLTLGLFLLLSWPANATAQTPACQPAETSAAVYDFVPESSLQTGDFRPLLRSETAFIEKLRTAGIEISDFTTPILPADIQPVPSHITGEMNPSPAQITDTYFFTGQIAKAGSGFLLSVQLKKTADGALLNEAKVPFGDAAAEAAGVAAATQMIGSFATRDQASRDDRANSDRAIDPHIEVMVDKLQMKPGEKSPVRIVLSDCDGVPLKHRTIQIYAQLTHASALVEDHTIEGVTDDNGERRGTVGANDPGVITYIAKFKYKDQQGIERERTDSRTIVVSGGEGHMWQMRADLVYDTHTLYYSKDFQSGRWSGRSITIRKKASMVFVFKADDTDPSGEVSVNEPKAFNGYGDVYFRDKSISQQESAELRIASAMLDQSQSAAGSLEPNFSISPGNNEFQVSLNNVTFVGTEEMFAQRLHPANYVHKTGIDYHEIMAASGSSPITPQMKKSGVYTFSKFERRPINTSDGDGVVSKGSTTGYEIVKWDFEVRRIAPGGPSLINH